MHQLTDLPDDAAKIPELGARSDRMLCEGTRNLLAAAKAADARPILAQSIAWELPDDRGVRYHEHEHAVLDAGGVVIRYGQLYGHGTYFETETPPRRGFKSTRRPAGQCRSSRCPQGSSK